MKGGIKMFEVKTNNSALILNIDLHYTGENDIISINLHIHWNKSSLQLHWCRLG